MPASQKYRIIDTCVRTGTPGMVASGAPDCFSTPQLAPSQPRIPQPRGQVNGCFLQFSQTVWSGTMIEHVAVVHGHPPLWVTLHYCMLGDMSTESTKKYEATAKGQDMVRAARKRFWQSEKGKAQRLRASQTDNGKRRNKQGQIKAKYGITMAHFEEMFAGQQGKCAICSVDLVTGLPMQKNCAHIDHDHESGRVRALLCKMCNLLVGHSREDVDILRKCMEYLLTHKIAVDLV